MAKKVLMIFLFLIILMTSVLFYSNFVVAENTCSCRYDNILELDNCNHNYGYIPYCYNHNQCLCKCDENPEDWYLHISDWNVFEYCNGNRCDLGEKITINATIGCGSASIMNKKLNLTFVDNSGNCEFDYTLSCGSQSCIENLTVTQEILDNSHCSSRDAYPLLAKLWHDGGQIGYEQMPGDVFLLRFGIVEQIDPCSSLKWYNIKNPHNQIPFDQCSLISPYNCVTNLSSSPGFTHFCLHNSSGNYTVPIQVGRGSGSGSQGSQNSIGGFFSNVWSFLTGSGIFRK